MTPRRHGERRRLDWTSPRRLGEVRDRRPQWHRHPRLRRRPRSACLSPQHANRPPVHRRTAPLPHRPNLLDQLQRPVQIDVSHGISRENCEFCYFATVSLRETFLGFLRSGGFRRRSRIHVIFHGVWGAFESRWGRSFSPATPEQAIARPAPPQDRLRLYDHDGFAPRWQQ
jgi:hypothetical protein